MTLILKYLPAVYGTTALPERVRTPRRPNRTLGITPGGTGAGCLAVSRRRSMWINRDGQVEDRTQATSGQAGVPILRLKGARRTFLWGFSEKQ
jgi:hypothetical protein